MKDSTKITLTLGQIRKLAKEAVEDLNAGASYDEIGQELEDADYESFCEQLSFLVKNNDPKAKALYDTFKEGWKDEYKDITVSEKFISIRDLHPTQNVIFANKSLVPMLNGEWTIGSKPAVEVVLSAKSVNVPLNDPLVVCNVGGTNYLIDGHHRWSKFYAFNPTCKLQAYIIEDKSGKGLFSSADDVLKFAQGTLAALGQDTINPQSGSDINMYDLASDADAGLEWMNNMVDKNITPEILQVAVGSTLGKINGITDNATLARYLWQNLYTNMFEYAPAGAHDREYMPQYPSGMDPETAVDTISENTKITLTVGQLRKLVKESNDMDNPLFGKTKQSAKRFIFKVIGDHKGMFRDDNWSHIHEIFDRMRAAGLDVSYGPVNDREHSGGYFRNEQGKLAGKEWEFSVDFINDRDRECSVTGRVMACFGGTVEQMDNDELGPDRPYDITVLFTC